MPKPVGVFYLSEVEESDKSSEDNDSYSDEDDGDFQTPETGTKPCSKQEVACAFVGRVKSLAKMYEEFAKNVNVELPKKTKISNSVSTSNVEGPSTSDDSVDCSSTSKEANSVEKKESESLESNRRLEVLEAKMDAVAAFVEQLHVSDLETLGYNFKEEIRTNEALVEVEKRIKDVDSSFEHVADGILDFMMSVGKLKGDNQKMKQRIAQLELTVLQGYENIKRVLQVTQNNFCDFSNKTLYLMNRYEVALFQVPQNEHEGNSEDSDDDGDQGNNE